MEQIYFLNTQRKQIKCFLIAEWSEKTNCKIYEERKKKKNITEVSRDLLKEFKYLKYVYNEAAIL